MIETCIQCKLKQFVSVNGKCRRCGALLGSDVIEIKLAALPAHTNSRSGLEIPLGAAIRSLRNRQHMTQSELARSSGVDRSMISRAECSSNSALNSKTLGKILLGLQVESLWLVSRSTPPP